MTNIVGVDEAGRGAIIGDVVAAAVLLPAQFALPELTDSKALSESKRETLAHMIKTQAIAYGIGRCSPADIARLNIHHASLLAMRRAIDALLDGYRGDIDAVWTDGKFSPTLPTSLAKADNVAFVKGDALHACISAASILAKTHRDAMMRELDVQHPEYGFAKHKGYPTKQHVTALHAHGVLPQHRKHYKTVNELLP